MNASANAAFGRHAGLLGLAVAAFGLLLVVTSSQDASAGAVLDNGVIQVGIADYGNLVVPGTTPSAGAGTTAVGLRLAATSHEGIAGGCGCEGWGVSQDGIGASVKGSAAPVGMTKVSFAATATTAQSIVDAGALRVTHATAPSSSTYAYRTEVTVENKGAAPLASIQYRRVVDWDVEPTPGQEFVTVRTLAAVPSLLLFSSDDGKASANPMAGPSAFLFTGPPTGASTDDSGPSDHGALMDLSLGCLGPGDKVTFQLYYGAAPTEATALSALSSLGAQAWSLAQPAGAAEAGTPQTFFLGFGGIDGLACLMPAFAASFTQTAPQDLTLDPVAFADASVLPSLPGLEQHTSWSFGDGEAMDGAQATHSYAKAGLYKACIHREARLPQTAWRTWSSCHDVAVHNRVPSADFLFENATMMVQFADQSTDLDGSVVAHAWTFGDGLNATGAQPGHTYTLGGIYSVCLTATDDDGGSSTTCHEVPAPGPENHPPFLVPIRSRHITAGTTVQVQLSAFDSDGDAITFTATALPDGALFDGAVGRFTWVPDTSQTGFHSGTTFAAHDGRGGVSERSLVVVVSLNSADSDLDGIADEADDCPNVHNPDQADADGDATGDACDDDTMATPDAEQTYLPPEARSSPEDQDVSCDGPDAIDRDRDRIPDLCDADIDGDGIANWGPDDAFLDNCPYVSNPDQKDSDGDGFGDSCAAAARAASEAGGLRPATAGQGAGASNPGLIEPAYQARPSNPEPADTTPNLSWILAPFAAIGLGIGIVVGITLRHRRR